MQFCKIQNNIKKKENVAKSQLKFQEDLLKFVTSDLINFKYYSN